MEESGAHSNIQPEDELEAFLQFGVPTAPHPDCLTPLIQLPKEFRKEIEKGYSTGWKCLDYYLQGLRLGELTIITADTGCGKTTFATHLMVNAAMQGIPVWINSWEMKPEVTMRKLASIILRRPMKVCNFNAHENEQFDEWASRYRVYINPKTIGTDINSLATQLIKAKELGVEIVMLDHLDYLVKGKSDKMYELIDETVKRLHEMAFALRMHFLLICHPRQSSTGSEEIGMHSLKGSSSIKQYADNIIVLHRCARTDSTADPNKVKVRIAKNRMFGTEGVTYLFYAPLWDGYEELRS